MINVTQTFLPPIGEYEQILKRAWDKKWITNRGMLALELEDLLRKFLDVKNLLLMNNGTIPLQIAIKALSLKGEIITTPFSYVATTAAIVWENCTPVFVDIDPEFLTIDEAKIEQAVTGKTVAIMATHVFGNPCDVDAIDEIAKKYNLPVIYDAAHSFGTIYKGKSVFEYGDVSTCSFHATKLFHTGEGGAIFCNNDELFQRLTYSHNFGHNGPTDFFGLGINAKISELQAAMGLAIFPYIEDIIKSRQQVVDTYNTEFQNSSVQTLRIRPKTTWNNCYYPIIFESEEVLLKVQMALNEKEVFPRRYFYPSLNTIDYSKGLTMPNSESIAKRILCLPLYAGLENEQVLEIAKIMKAAL